ncbi:MAG: hypothetical protein IPO19_04960 [Rhodoferax sp.]|nr:hypothetical protein [Rhodoferax sp.]
MRLFFVSIVAVASGLAASIAGLFLLGERAPELQYEKALPYVVLMFLAGSVFSALVADRCISEKKL